MYSSTRQHFQSNLRTNLDQLFNMYLINKLIVINKLCIRITRFKLINLFQIVFNHLKSNLRALQILSLAISKLRHLFVIEYCRLY